jgi:mannose-6-phosphate isomerase-like protein (cupin superfamily)
LVCLDEVDVLILRQARQALEEGTVTNSANAAGTGGDVLALYPGGYPLTIDVASAHIDAAGTAMHFMLPKSGHNFPLLHDHESKLVVALEGELQLRCGAMTLAHLMPGQGALVAPRTAHRIVQVGQAPSLVGVALWPGTVEAAFREVVVMVAARGFQRQEVIDLFATYSVHWSPSALAGCVAHTLDTAAWTDLLSSLPPPLATLLPQSWAVRGR